MITQASNKVHPMMRRRNKMRNPLPNILRLKADSDNTGLKQSPSMMRRRNKMRNPLPNILRLKADNDNTG